jgi:hypothetical protein
MTSAEILKLITRRESKFRNERWLEPLLLNKLTKNKDLLIELAFANDHLIFYPSEEKLLRVFNEVYQNLNFSKDSFNALWNSQSLQMLMGKDSETILRTKIFEKLINIQSLEQLLEAYKKESNSFSINLGNNKTFNCSNLNPKHEFQYTGSYIDGIKFIFDN